MSAAMTCPPSDSVIDIRTWRGSCDGCGECCGRFLPLTEGDIARLESYVRKKRIKPTPRSFESGGETFVSFNCSFLGYDKMCMVYEARPAICRVYRCDQHKAGTMRLPEWDSMPRIVDMREVFG